MSMYDAFKYFERAAELVADDGASAQGAGRARPVRQPRSREATPSKVVGSAGTRVVTWVRLVAAAFRPHGGTA
jgi:hypothetical protein